jgi:AcrR family transcriptional regulator
VSVLPRTGRSPRDPASLSQQAAARRDEILEVALEIFSRKGFHDTSISAVAKRAGASRATVYQYFRDKSDILAAIGQRVEQRIVAAVNAWVPLPPDVAASETSEPAALLAGLRAMIDMRLTQVLAMLAENADATRLTLRLVRGNDGGLEAAVRRIDAHVVAILANDIRTAIANGWARPTDPEMVARYLLGGVEKILMDVLVPEEALELDVPAAVRSLGALVFYGLVHPDLLRRALLESDGSLDDITRPDPVPRLPLAGDTSTNEVPATQRDAAASPPPTDPRRRGPSGRTRPM